MSDVLRVELPIKANSQLLSKCNTIGEVIKEYKLRVVKYIYIDPDTNKLTGANPPLELPLQPDAYITVVGEFKHISKFTEHATKTK